MDSRCQLCEPNVLVALSRRSCYNRFVAVREFGIRELRNDTRQVLDATEAGDLVFLTNRGRRVAELRSTSRSTVDALLERAAEIGGIDTDWLDELEGNKAADRSAQTDRWA